MAATLFSTEAATGEGVGTSLSPWGAGNQGAWELGRKKLPNYFHEAVTATWLCGDITGGQSWWDAVYVPVTDRDHDTPDREREMSYDTPYMQNLKRNPASCHSPSKVIQGP